MVRSFKKEMQTKRDNDNSFLSDAFRCKSLNINTHIRNSLFPYNGYIYDEHELYHNSMIDYIYYNEHVVHQVQMCLRIHVVYVLPCHYNMHIFCELSFFVWVYLYR